MRKFVTVHVNFVDGVIGVSAAQVEVMEMSHVPCDHNIATNLGNSKINMKWLFDSSQEL